MERTADEELDMLGMNTSDSSPLSHYCLLSIQSQAMHLRTCVNTCLFIHEEVSGHYQVLVSLCQLTWYIDCLFTWKARHLSATSYFSECNHANFTCNNHMVNTREETVNVHLLTRYVISLLLRLSSMRRVTGTHIRYVFSHAKSQLDI